MKMRKNKFDGKGMALRKSVILSLFAGTGLLTVVMAWILSKYIYNSNVASEKKYLESSMEQIIHSVELNETREEEMYEIFETDCLNRANIAANLYSKEKNSGIDWEYMLNILEVEKVNVVDEYGTITDSSDSNSIGINFYENEEFKEFLPLVEGRSGQESHIQRESISDETKERKIYVGVKRADTPKGIILLEISSESLEQYENLVSLKNILNSVPTERYQYLFAVEQKTGKLIALSENDGPPKEYSMEPILDMKEGETRNGTFRDAAGKKWIATFLCREGIIYGYASDVSGIQGRINKSFVMSLASVVVLNVFVLLLVYWLLGYTVLADLETITQKLEMFINGTNTVYFIEGKNREIKNLSYNLNKLVSVIKAKPKGLCSLVNMFGEGVAAYEYYEDLDQIFCSDNLIPLAEISEEEVFKKIRSQYDNVKMERKVWEDGLYEEERYQTSSGRALMVYRTYIQNASYGLVQNITEDMKTIHNLNARLSEEKSRNVTDSLTGLFNRKKIEEDVRQIFQEEHPRGMLILIDLDNFKKINDKAGHMEGDNVLKIFGGILKGQFRSTDLKARLGGDEFVILLRQELTMEMLQTKLNGFLEEVRTQLQEYYRDYKLSVSIGVAVITPDVHSYEELYRNADAAMYVVKRTGKDGFYVNTDNNTCMRENCIRCRAVCARRKWEEMRNTNT